MGQTGTTLGTTTGQNLAAQQKVRRHPEDTVGAHAGNNNYDSLGVCFEGSFDRETMPDAQLRAGQELVAYLKQKYGISTVQRHSDVNATGCPGDNFPFDALAGAQTAKPQDYRDV